MTARDISRAAAQAPGRELGETYWATLARTADLVRKLTSLADRYDRAIEPDDPRAAERRAATALMRATAASGRQLIGSLAPPALPDEPGRTTSVQELADTASSRDVRAAARDAVAEGRDHRAADRDARVRALSGDDDRDFAARFLAACDRDDAAGDRAAAREDRRAAARDRGLPQAGGLEAQAGVYALLTTLEQRALVRQAQGALMQRAGVTAGEAFAALVLATTGALTLDDVAAYVLENARLPLEHGAL